MKKIILIIALMLGAASVQAQDIFSLGQMLKNLMPDTTATEQGMLGSHYFIADYRGDVRCVIDDAGTLEESTSYYPYGMPHGTGLLSSVQPYKYTGKELDRETGLDWYDSQARMYDPTLIVTTTMDPLAEKYYSMSPYLWCGGNPVKYVDYSGKEILVCFHDSDTRLTSWAKSYKDDGAIHVFAHGNKDAILIHEVENKHYIKTPAEFKEQVLSKSEVWKKAKNKEGLVIILHSCSTGKGENSFAEKLSDDVELKDVTIVAPSKNIGVTKNGESYVRDEKKNKKGEKIGENKGCWKVFKNGEVITSFDSDWKAKEHPTFFDRLFH